MNKKWFRLDTAALIFPAIARKNWRNSFRMSATLSELVDPEILQQAVGDLKARFPSFYVSLHCGAFWYYLEESSEKVVVEEDYAYPLTLINDKELKKNCMHVLYHQNRIAVEFFHVLTDGRGGITFLSNLIARYLELKEGIEVPKEGLLYDLNEKPLPEELEDSFLKNAAEVAMSGRESHAYLLHGETESDGFRHLITGILDTKQLLEAARAKGISVTAFLTAVMVQSIMEIQDLETPRRKQKPVKIMIPVDLRLLFGSKTLRNFALVVNPGVDPRYGDYSFEDLCQASHYQLRTLTTRQNMAAMIAANVIPQKIIAVRLAPVFLKNWILDFVYGIRGERCGCLNISNLNELRLPEVMQPFVERVEFIIGTQRNCPHNCSMVSYKGKTYINMIRSIRESELERRFFSHLVELGIAVEIESNRRP